MAVKEGYKQTEIGLIPEDWEVKTMSHVTDVRDGTHESPKYHSSGVKFVTSKNIVNGILDFSEITFISEDDAEHINKRSKVDIDDILMAMIGTIGDAVLIDRTPDFCIKNVALIKPYKDKIYPKYLYQLVVSNVYQNYIQSKLAGGIQKFISLSMLRSLYVVIPPLPEQKAIATALSDIDGLIDSLSKLIEKKKKIKQGAMQDLLTGKKRLEGFSGEWVEVKVSSFGEIITGFTPPIAKSEYWNGIIPWVTPTDIKENKNIYKTERSITKDGLSIMRKLKANSVLVTCIASIGKNAILKVEGACNQQINAIMSNDKYDSDFIYYLFENNKHYLQSKAGITATNIVSKNIFSEIIFWVPPRIEEQTAIASILSDMDSEIEKLQAKLEKYKAIKQGMMQELLTGKTRLLEGA